jgi:hypothetical protein
MIRSTRGAGLKSSGPDKTRGQIDVIFDLNLVATLSQWERVNLKVALLRERAGAG